MIEIYSNKVRAMELPLTTNYGIKVINTSGIINGENYIDFNFNGNQTINYETWQININVFRSTTEFNRKLTWYISNTDRYITTETLCNDWWGVQTGQATVRYQDGTTATIDYGDYEKYCKTLTTTGKITTADNQGVYVDTIETAQNENTYIDNNIQYNVYMITNRDQLIPCETNTNGNTICKPLYTSNNNKSYKGIRVYISQAQYNTNNLNIINIIVNKNYMRYTSTQDETNNILYENQEQQQQNWDNFNNTDIGESAKEEPNINASEQVNNKEEELYNSIKQDPNELDILSIDLDPDTNNWIWNTFNSLVSTHRYIIILIVSILTIGLAKQILQR